jgi:predicted amidohydrolase
VAANLITHMRFIAAAQAAGVDALVFPELSLSGYEPTLLRDCLLKPEDPWLLPLRACAKQARMTIIVGAPVASPDARRPHIGALAFFADGRHAVFLKQHLHGGEDVFATAGSTLASHSFALQDTPAALAICAESMHPPHAERAAASGAALYLASSLVSVAGFAAEVVQLQHHANALNMGVLLANHGGPSGGYTCAGKSSFWAPGGELVVQAPGAGDVLVIATREGEHWQGEVLAVPI